MLAPRRLLAALGIAALLTATAPTAASADAPPPRYYRFTLADGRLVDGELVGSDAQTYQVKTADGATISIPRASVVGTVELAEKPEKPEDQISTFQKGLGVFIVGYGLPILAAAIAGDKDSDRDWALVPVAGPIIWTSKDEDEWGTDGFDWLAAGCAALQVAGIAAMAYGLVVPSERKGPDRVTVSPLLGRGVAGIVVGTSL